MSDTPSLTSVLQRASAGHEVLTRLSTTPAPKKAEAAEQFEAFVMQSFIQELLPKDSEGVFGQGIAGDIWKSLLAQQLGAEVASRGSTGIADYITGADATRAAADAARAAASGPFDSSLLATSLPVALKVEPAIQGADTARLPEASERE